MASTKHIQLIPTLGTTPDYSDGDIMGPVIVVSDFFAVNKVMKLVSGMVRDAANVGPAFKLLFFKAVPAGGTYTDNGALALSAADLSNLIGVLPVASAAFGTASANKVQALANQQYIIGPGIDNLWVLCVAGGTYNAAAATDLTVDLDFETCF